MWAGTGTCKHSPVRNQPRERGMGPVLSRLFAGRGVAGRGCRAGSEEPVAPCTSSARSAACSAPAPARWGRSLPPLGRDLLGEEPGHSSCEEAQLGLVSSRAWLQGEHARMWLRPGLGLWSSPHRHRELGWAPLPRSAGGSKGSFNINYSGVRKGMSLSPCP